MDAGMVFGLIFTICVMAMILFFGLDQIADFFGFGTETQVHRELKEVAQDVDRIYNMAENSGEPHTLSIPESTKICFFNSSNPSPRIYADDSISWKPDAAFRTIIKSEGYNTWYYAGSKRGGYAIHNLDMPSDKNFCAPGGTRVYITRMYNGVVIEPVLE